MVGFLKSHILLCIIFLHRQGTSCSTVASPHLGVDLSSALTSVRCQSGSPTGPVLWFSSKACVLEGPFVDDNHNGFYKTSGAWPPVWVDWVQGVLWAQHLELVGRCIQAKVCGWLHEIGIAAQFCNAVLQCSFAMQFCRTYPPKYFKAFWPAFWRLWKSSLMRYYNKNCSPIYKGNCFWNHTR